MYALYIKRPRKDNARTVNKASKKIDSLDYTSRATIVLRKPSTFILPVNTALQSKGLWGDNLDNLERETETVTDM